MNRQLYRIGVCLFLFSFLFIGSPLVASHTVTDGLGREVEVPDHAERIVSGGLSITATLAELIDPDRLVAVEPYAGDTRFSFVADTVAGIPTLRQVQPETILARDPDLIFLTPFTPAPIRQRIIEMDIPIVVTDKPLTLEDVNRNIRLIGSSLHQRKSAQQLTVSFDTEPSVAPSPRVLYYLRSGVLPGNKTVPSSIMKQAGVRNVLTEENIVGWKSVSAELLVKLDPDWIVIDRIGAESTRSTLENDPVFSRLSAVRNDRIVELWPKYLTVAGPHVQQAIQRWEVLKTEILDRQ